jgi:D-alanine-D-alanine ligase
VFNALHGTYGEDGCVPGMLEIMNIPYTHSGVLASALALDKLVSGDLFIKSGILCPKRVVIEKNSEFLPDPIPRPYIVKPLSQGSSVGIEVMDEDNTRTLKDYDFKWGNKVIVEEFIDGVDLQVAIVNGKAIGVMELELLKSKFYDYETKYTEGLANHIYPANIPAKKIEETLSISEKANQLLQITGPARAEFRYNKKTEELYFIEINTHPGFTKTSIVPEIMGKEGVSFTEFLQLIIDEAILRYEQKR